MPTTTHSVWRGSDAIKLQPTYPRFRRTAKGDTLTLVFRGPYVDLRTYGPDLGDEIVLSAFDYEPGATVLFATAVECQPDGAGEDGAGTLTVVYSNEVDGGGEVIGAGGTLVIYEVDWSALEKKLETHPRYNNTTFAPYGFSAGTTSYTKNSGGTGTIVDLWDLYKRATDAERAALRGDIDLGAAALVSMLDDLMQKHGAGVEAYLVPAPVARKTTRGPGAGSAAACGGRTTSAPFAIAPSGYQWLKTADRIIRQGPSSTWEQVEEWTGAKAWSADLYGGIL